MEKTGSKHWQDFFNSTQSAISKLERNSEFSDVIFRIEENAIPAHSFLLIIRSKFFDVLFSERWNTEEKQEDKKVIELGAPVTLVGLECLLSHIYQGKERITHSNFHEVWATANYFQVESLKKRCLLFMINELNFENCLYFLEAMRMFPNREEEFFEYYKCLEFIDFNFVEIFSQPNNFKDCSSDVLRIVFERDSLNIPSEQFLFHVLLTFIEIKCDSADATIQRNFLEENNLLWVVRYIFLSEEDLLSAGFLDPKEVIKIRRNALSIKTESDETTTTSIEAKTRKFNSVWPYVSVVRLPSEQSNGEWSLSSDDSIKVWFDQPVFLCSVTLVGPKFCAATFEYSLIINNIGFALSEKKNVNVQQGQNIMITFDKRPLLKANRWYVIQLSMTSDQFSVKLIKRNGGKSSQTVNVGGQTLNIQWDGPNARIGGTSASQGQFPEISVEIAREQNDDSMQALTRYFPQNPTVGVKGGNSAAARTNYSSLHWHPCASCDLRVQPMLKAEDIDTDRDICQICTEQFTPTCVYTRCEKCGFSFHNSCHPLPHPYTLQT